MPAVRNVLREANQRPHAEGFSLIKQVIEQVADPREYLHEPEKVQAVVEYLNERLVPTARS